MQTIKIGFCGRDYYFAYNGNAMFQLRDILPEGDPIERLQSMLSMQDHDSFHNLCKVVSVLSEQGELIRRYQGYENQDMLTEEMVSVMATPLDMIDLKNAVVSAVLAGYKREVEPQGDVDLGLAEIQKKRKKR